MSSSPTVIVVTHRGAEVIDSLLDSIAAQSTDHETIVVDNGSRDGTAQILASRPGIDVVRLERNMGFSHAVNSAAARAQGEVLVLVNDDSRLDHEFVERIAAPIDPGSSVVMAAGVMRDAGDERLIDTAGMELDRTLLVFDYLNGEPLTRLDSAGVSDPIGPSGAAAAFDREAFRELGGFDEALFAYWEDVDLVLRLREAGGCCVLAPDARGVHLHSATLGSGSAEKNRMVGYGRGYLIRKWGVLSPTRLPGILARDGAICLGQLIMDRNAGGLVGRIRGWRESSPGKPFPANVLREADGPGAGTTLARRLRRRRRLAGRSSRSP